MPELRTPSFSAWLIQRWPGSPWEHARHLQYVAQMLGTLPPGGRLILNMPPRHAKTQTVTVRYVAWRMIRWPSLRVIIATHTQTLAEALSRQVRRIVREAGVALDPEHNRVTDWRTRSGGGLRAAGVGAAIAGFGAGLIVVDDPHRNREAADSLRQRDQLWEWWNDDLLTRREPGCQVLVVMTRYHPDDLVGRILASDPTGWYQIRLPARADSPDDPLGRAIGDPLWPEVFGDAELRRIEQQVDPRTWSALYQQLPRLAESVTILPEWFPLYRPNQKPPSVGRWISWDTSEGTEAGAYSVGWVADVGIDGALYVVDRVRVRLPFTELVQTMFHLAQCHVRDGLREVLVERASTGGAAYDVLRRELARVGIPVEVVGVRPASSKIVRAEAASLPIRQGLVRLPEGAPWLDEFFRELAAFPHGAYADQVDALTQLVTYLAHFLVPHYDASVEIEYVRLRGESA
ncbi:phage terminase large subunit (plasmid) [Thermomicrobium sp. 4228-Ro]|uniref:phage terminase large subunit n=1 Tax=Thermomicrobium sp. 4228-Ro TaxID=2993937 RepID=UPI002249782B|nr:phage terminase large subunit [Thermomicrobium sp. 4228-Ro]MCX2728542.1 phage terminase large subunit [Thermomicrobium sp. 4228-Ro]